MDGRKKSNDFLEILFAQLPSTEDYKSYREILRLNEITVEIAIGFDQETLKNLGISKKLHRNKVLKIIAQITSDPDYEKLSAKSSRTHSPSPEQAAAPREPVQFFINLNMVKLNQPEDTFNWINLIEDYFSNYGHVTEVRMKKAKKLLFLTVLISDNHLDKFPKTLDEYFNHKISGMILRIKRARPFDPSFNKSNYVNQSKPVSGSGYQFQVGVRVSCKWQSQKLPGTICEMQGDGGKVGVIFDNYEGFKELLNENDVYPLVNDPLHYDRRKAESLTYGTPVTCTFGTERKLATVVSVKNSIVFVKRGDVNENEAATIFDVRIGSQGIKQNVNTFENILANKNDRIHVEAEIIVAVEQEIEEKGNAYMRYSTLLHTVRIPYRMYGFNRPLDFVKSIKKLRVEETPNQFPRLYLCEHEEPQVKRPGFDDEVMEFVYNFLRTHPNYDYVPYNTLVHGLEVPKHELEAVGYKRLLDYMKEHDKFRVTQHPDARLWLIGDLEDLQTGT